ncbi:MAG: hypothetical protein IJ512_07465 [Ruminococcus sp.]|nr:hypothetical protein [Ruminococcus sp.]
MSTDLLNFLKSAYENDSACVLIFDSTPALLWHNDKPAPFDIGADLPALLHFPETGFPRSGDYTFYVKNTLYEYHLTNVKDTYCIVSCSCQSVLHKVVNSREQREQLTNQIALQHQETFGIRSAVTQIYELIEESECEQPLQDELYECLNMISINCANLLKMPYTLREMLRYADDPDETPMPLNCTAVLEDFVNRCRLILGRRSKSVRILLHAEPELMADIPRDRLEFCLICILLILCGKERNCQTIRIRAEENNGYADIHFLASETGDEDITAHLTSRFVPLYDVPAFEAEQLILNQFRQKYNASIVESASPLNGSKALRLRIPLSDISLGAKLHTSLTDADRDKELFYQAMLSELTEFRCY